MHLGSTLRTRSRSPAGCEVPLQLLQLTTEAQQLLTALLQPLQARFRSIFERCSTIFDRFKPYKHPPGLLVQPLLACSLKRSVAEGLELVGELRRSLLHHRELFLVVVQQLLHDAQLLATATWICGYISYNVCSYIYIFEYVNG